MHYVCKRIIRTLIGLLKQTYFYSVIMIAWIKAISSDEWSKFIYQNTHFHLHGNTVSSISNLSCITLIRYMEYFSEIQTWLEIEDKQ